MLRLCLLLISWQSAGHQRLVYVLTKMIGSLVQVPHEQRPLSSHASQVQVMNGKVYFGVFHGAEIVNGELNVALRMAHLKLGADAGWRTARAARRRARGD